MYKIFILLLSISLYGENIYLSIGHKRVSGYLHCDTKTV